MAKEIITRRSAWARGLKRYYTGERCRHGHDAERFVSNAGCVQCVNPFKARRSAFDHRAIPYMPVGLWVHKALDETQHKVLTEYLQRCILEFVAVNLPNEAPLVLGPPADLPDPLDGPVVEPLSNLPEGFTPPSFDTRAEE